MHSGWRTNIFNRGREGDEGGTEQGIDVNLALIVRHLERVWLNFCPAAAAATTAATAAAATFKDIHSMQSDLLGYLGLATG